MSRISPRAGIPAVLCAGAAAALFRIWTLPAENYPLVVKLIFTTPVIIFIEWVIFRLFLGREDRARMAIYATAPLLAMAVFAVQSHSIVNYSQKQTYVYLLYLGVCFILAECGIILSLTNRKPVLRMFCWGAFGLLYILRTAYMPIQYGFGGIDDAVEVSASPMRNLANAAPAVFFVVLALAVLEASIYYGSIKGRVTMQYIAGRFLVAMPLLLGMSFVTYTIINLSPGNYFTQYKANPQISRALVERLEKQYHYDKPYAVRYCYWLLDLTEGNLGYSLERRMPVLSVIRSAMFNTILLNIVSLALSWGVALPIGIYAAVHRYTWRERGMSFLAFLGICTPEFFLCLLLLYGAMKAGTAMTMLLVAPMAFAFAKLGSAPIDMLAWNRQEGSQTRRIALLSRIVFLTLFGGLLYLASRWGRLPTGGMTSPGYDQMNPLEKVSDIARHMVVPVFVLGFGSIAFLQRLMRGNMLETLRQQYIITARAKGLPENRVIYTHALRNAINPMVTILGFSFAGLLSGAGLLEIICSWPGLGSIMLEAVLKKDIHLVMGSMLIGGALLILGNLLADVLLAQVDPRVKYG